MRVRGGQCESAEVSVTDCAVSPTISIISSNSSSSIGRCKNAAIAANMQMYILCNNLGLLIYGLLFLLAGCEGGRIFDVTNIPIERFVAVAGQNITMPCPGVYKDSLVNALTWKTTNTVAQYANGIPLVYNSRIALLPRNYSLYFRPVVYEDSGEYFCLVNDRHSPEKVIELLVHDIPGAPGRPLIVSFTSRSVNLSWAHSQEPRNTIVTHFTIETRLGEDGPWDAVPAIVTTSNTTSHQMTGLLPFTVYSFRVIAENGLGVSTPSKESYYIVTLREAPIGKPVTTIAHNTSASSIYISWKAPPADTILGEFLGYRITYKIRDRPMNETHELYIRDSGVESHEIHNLETYTQYLVSLQVFNPEGLGPVTTVLVMTDEGVPSPPYNLTVIGVTATTIKIEWHEPANPNGLIDGYRVVYINQNETYIQTKMKNKEPGPIVSYELSNLKPYAEYVIMVRAFTWKNQGNASNVVAQRTDISGPSPPIVVNLTCHSSDTLYVRWKRPLEFYNSIDFYIISYKSAEEPGFQEIRFNTSAEYLETAMKLPNLTMNMLYEVKVRAASISTINPRQLILGSYSEPKKILVQLHCERIEPLLRQSQNEYSVTTIAVIVFSVFGVLLLLMAVLLWRKCFHVAYYYLDDAPCQGPSTPLIDWEAPVQVAGETRNAVPVAEFAKHVAELHADGDIGFSKEYEALQAESLTEEYASENSQHAENKTKNRYLNIIAYDHSRVHLRSAAGQRKTVDYINANFIDGYQRSRAFIGTQGPLPHTFDCFWRMVWEQRVQIIVMITNLVERGRRKCDMYWPKDGSETYGVIQVRFVDEQVMATYTVRTFNIRHLKLKPAKKKGGGSGGGGGSEAATATERLVYQYHYTNWPDHGTPDHPLPVLNFVRKSAEANPPEAGPIVVHCSAGVGRTGTYIVLDAMLKQIAQKQVVNVFGFLRHIRAQRNFLVQTEEQYIFVHDALCELIASGDTCVPAGRVMEMRDNGALLAEQFRLITEYQARDVHRASAVKAVNAPKNRTQVVPLEGSRVHLTPRPGEEGSDYINASWLQGFRRLRDFIVTQHPLQHTVKDFWQMVWDHNAQTIVLLTALDDPQAAQFWPDDTASITTDYYRVHYESKLNKCDYVCRNFVMQSIQDDYELNVRMLHCPSWPELGHPASIFDFVLDVHQRASEYRNGPIVVVDKYGGPQSVSFCVVSAQAMQLEHDATTNVYTYAKLYHQKRPGCWQSADDLRQIYRILAYMPGDLELLKCTEMRTELEDLTTVTPDLYSKICSNGNISSSLNANPNGGNGGGGGLAGMMLMGGGGGGGGGGGAVTAATVSATQNGGGGGGGGGALMATTSLSKDGGGGTGEDEFSVVVTEPDCGTNIDV